MKKTFVAQSGDEGSAAHHGFVVNGWVASPMNYIGGKYRLLGQIMPCFPSGIGKFVDLFCGGCSVGINVRAERVVFNDNLTYLVDMYRLFLTMPTEQIVNHIDGRIAEYGLSDSNEDGYLRLREMYNSERNPIDLFVLMAFSFNHQIRFNNSHKYNNPFGRARSSFNERMRRNLYGFLNVLKSRNVEFRCSDFRGFCVADLTGGDFVYCDPPYLISTGTYNDGRRGFDDWGVEEEQDLHHMLDGLTERGIPFALSNVICHKGQENEILRDWICRNGYHVLHLNANYANASYHAKCRSRDMTDEVLVTNYRTPVQTSCSF